VTAAEARISTPHSSKCTGKPSRTPLGQWPSKTATRRGTKKIRSSVSELGTFMMLLEMRAGRSPSCKSAPGFDYSLAGGARQSRPGAGTARRGRSPATSGLLNGRWQMLQGRLDGDSCLDVVRRGSDQAWIILCGCGRARVALLCNCCISVQKRGADRRFAQGMDAAGAGLGRGPQTSDNR